MYVCMHVCMYVCVCVCVYAPADLCSTRRVPIDIVVLQAIPVLLPPGPHRPLEPGQPGAALELRRTVQALGIYDCSDFV